MGQQMLAIRLSGDVEKRLEILAEKTGRTKTYYAREAIMRYLEDIEDYYLAKERLASPSKRWTLDELLNEQDL
jgi:RHH-type rel operon transcriptional repressor/antitoxin RelB